MTHVDENEKIVEVLLRLPSDDVALLDMIKRRCGASSRGKAVSFLLASVIDMPKPSVRLANTVKMSQRKTKKLLAETEKATT